MDQLWIIMEYYGLLWIIIVIMNTTYNMNYTKENANTLINLGYLYKNLGNNKEARECFLKAQELNPELFNK